MKLSIPLFLAMAFPAVGTMACPTTTAQDYDLVVNQDIVVGSLNVTEVDYDTLKVCFDLEGHADLTPNNAGDDNSQTELIHASVSVGCDASTVIKTVSYQFGTLAGCATITKPDCPYESPIKVNVEAQVDKLGGFEFMHDYLPVRVSYRNYYDGVGGEADSYFDVEFLEGPFAGFKIDSWCIDINHDMGDREYTGLAISGYDDDLAQVASNVDDPSRLPSTAWLINQYRVGEMYDVDYEGGGATSDLCPKDFPDGHDDGDDFPQYVQTQLTGLGDDDTDSFTLNEATLQRAIWYLIDNSQSTAGIGGYNDRLACFLAWEALLHRTYEPGCGDLIPIVLVPDPETTVEQQTLVAQTTFASLEIPCDTISETAFVSGTFQMTCRPEIGAVVGDPHIYSFDGLLNDCQAAGEFVLFTTPDSTRQMHARFEHFTDAGYWSVTKAIAVQDLDDAPKVEIAVPIFHTSPVSGEIASCPVMFYVNGVQRQLTDGSGDSTVDVTATGTEAVILYVNTGLKVTVSTAYANGCMLNIAVEFPGRDDSTIGLMGSPNGNPLDDWMSPDGTLIEVPSAFGARSSEEGYHYCTTNWCVTEAEQSLFTYAEAGADFGDFQHCGLPFGGTFMSELAGTASPEVIAFCGDDQQCLIDGIMGGLEAAQAAVAIRGAIAQTCNAIGGECQVASCCGGLSCETMDVGDKQCVQPEECPACLDGTSGACINDGNSVCYGLQGGACPVGTSMCHNMNILQRTENVQSGPDYAECGGCWWGSAGPCQATNTVCYPLNAYSGACPTGTAPCEARRQLRGH